MKSKVREIVVDSHSYMWTVTELDWHTVNIKVWVKGNTRTPWFEVKKKFDDPWLNFSELSKGQLKSNKESSSPVTPGLIAAYIKEVKTRNLELIANKPIYLHTNSEGHLLVQQDNSS